MKKINYLKGLIVFFLFNSTTFSQDVEVKLNTSDSTSSFSIQSSINNKLFTFDGGGGMYFGSSAPSYLLKVTSSLPSPGDYKGRGILLQAEDFFSSDYSVGASLQVNGGKLFPSPTGGDIQITAGMGKYGGDINIESGYGGYGAGNINILTGSTGATGNSGNFTVNCGEDTNDGGNILLTAGMTYNGNGGDIELKAGFGNLDGGNVSIIAGENWHTNFPRGNILLQGANGNSDEGGNIILTPGEDTLGTNDGIVILNGSGTYSGTWTQASDARYKQEINKLDGQLDDIMKLNPVSYKWKKEEYPNKNFNSDKSIGLIAQEVEQIFPEIVKTDAQGYKSIEYSKLSVILLQAIKEQQKEIEELKRLVK